MDELSTEAARMVFSSALAGGGIVGLMGWAALRFYLSKDFFSRGRGEDIEKRLNNGEFAKQKELDGFGLRVNEMERQGTPLSKQNRDHLVRLESDIRRDLVGPIQEMTKTLQDMREQRVADRKDLDHQGSLLAEIRDMMRVVHSRTQP